MKILNLLNESVTIVADHHSEKSRYGTVLDISYNFRTIIFDVIKKKYPFFYKYLESIGYRGIYEDPLMDTYDKSVGAFVISFKNIDARYYSNMNDAIMETVKLFKNKGIIIILVKATTSDVGRLDDLSEQEIRKLPNADPDTANLVILNVDKNNVEGEDLIELNISNTNARVVFELLGIKTDELIYNVSPTDVQKYLMRLYNIDRNGLDVLSREDSVDNRPARVQNGEIRRGPTIYQMGLSTARIKDYIDQLIKIFEQAKRLKSGVTLG